MKTKKSNYKNSPKPYHSLIDFTQKRHLSNPLVILFGAIIIFNLLLFGWNYKQSHKPVVIGQLSKPTAYPTPTAAPSTPFPSVYKTKHYNPQDKFAGSDYTYSDLLPKDDNLSVKTSCSPLYSRISIGNEDNTVYINGIRQKVSPIVISYFNKLQDTEPKEIVEIMVCTDDNKTIALHSRVCGGGCHTPSVSIFENNDLTKTIEIPNDINIAYFGCRKFLELTKNGDLFMNCAGGDGPSGGSILYKFNLHTYSLFKIKSCTSESTGNGSSHTECN